MQHGSPVSSTGRLPSPELTAAIRLRSVHGRSCDAGRPCHDLRKLPPGRSGSNLHAAFVQGQLVPVARHAGACCRHCFSAPARAQAGASTASAIDPDRSSVKSLGVVTISGSSQPTALPSQIPATMQGVTREQIARTVNATDSEDALKYLPGLLVRKRCIGDYNHAILSSRASGTGNPYPQRSFTAGPSSTCDREQLS